MSEQNIAIIIFGWVITGIIAIIGWIVAAIRAKKIEICKRLLSKRRCVMMHIGLLWLRWKIFQSKCL